MKQIEVAAGILIHQGQILCLQRGQGKFDYISYKYEFPGGKLELGEQPETALIRELAEEMHLEIEANKLRFYSTVTHPYPDFVVTMHCFFYPLHNRVFDLVEHIDFRWLDPADLDQLDWAEADWPIVRRLMKENLK